MSQEQNKNQLQIKSTEKIQKGEYANAMQVMHTKEKYDMDFRSTSPPVANLVGRIIVSPGQINLIIAALQDNLKRYESQFGNVTPSEQSKNPIGFQSE